MSLNPAPSAPNKGGRPLGKPNDAKVKAAKALGRRIVGAGLANPLEVMVDNMHFWHNQANELTQQLRELVVARDDQIIDPALIQEANTLLKKMIACREQSQRCAVDAAPYLHAKLATIQIKPASEDNTRVTNDQQLAQLDERDLAAEYRAALQAPQGVPVE